MSLFPNLFRKKPERPQAVPIARVGRLEVLGVDLSWAASPVVIYRWPDGEVGYLPKPVDPWEHFDAKGWPLMENGEKMPIAPV